MYINSGYKMNEKRSSRRGQVSIYFILGLVIIFIFSLSFLAFQKLAKPSYKYRNTYIENEIKSYVESCLYKLSIEAFEKIGEGGGYINPSNFRTAIYDHPEKGDAFFITHNKIMPYWLYGDGCNLVLKYPTLIGGPESVASQVKSYVERNIAKCLNDYKPITLQGWEIKHKVPKVNVEFGDDSTKIDMKMEVTAENRNRTAIISIDEFSTKLDLHFKDIYRDALSIVYGEYLDADVSSRILDFIRGEALLKNIPPLSEISTEISFNPNLEYWLFDDIKKRISNVLLSDLQFMTTKYSFTYLRGLRTDDQFDLQEYFYRSNLYAITPKLFRDTPLIKRVNFIWMPSWGFYLHISPGSYIYMPRYRKIFPPPPFDKFFPSLYVVDSSFLYDVAVPILVSLKYPDELKGKGYTFTFGLEANILDNKALPNHNCSQALPLNQTGRDKLCFSKAFGGSKVYVKAKDVITGLRVENYTLEFTCGPISCMIPKNDTITLPACNLGQLRIIKPGYYSATVNITSLAGGEQEINVTLYPINYKVKAKVRILWMEKGSGDPYDGLAVLCGNNCGELDEKRNELPQPENNWVVTTEISSIPKQEEFAMIVMYPKEPHGTPAMALINTSNPIVNMSLVPGNYSIDITYMHNIGENYTQKKKTLIIPDDMRCVAFHCEGPDHIDINSTLLLGGAHIENFEVKAEDLYNSDTLEFKILALKEDDITDIRDLANTNLYYNITSLLPGLFSPTWR